VVYQLRRPWPHAGGSTHLVLDPLDFLRRLAALVSFPRSHSVRRHGVFANRSRWRRCLPPPPPSRYAETEDSEGPPRVKGTEAPADEVPQASTAGGVVAAAAASGGAGTKAGVGKRESAGMTPRRRVSWAQLLRRVLQVDALVCPRCSTREQRVPMVVPAFLSDPEVVQKILTHLGLPTIAPALAVVRTPQPEIVFALPEEDAGRAEWSDGGDAGPGEPLTRPPP